jgi:S1-C subfamily serine protease
MKRVPLYSSSRSATVDERDGNAPSPEIGDAPPVKPQRAWRRVLQRFERPLWLVAGALFALAGVVLHAGLTPGPRALTQKDIDASVMHTLETQTTPSPATRAYEKVRPSVVRVRGLGKPNEAGKREERSTGTGVVILENGTILTNLHVVSMADALKVVFDDGSESDAAVVGTRPEHDLAVIRATTLPDDLLPATLRSTRDLREGERVIAVGFPFGIGPSVSSGIVSGLRREYQTPEGKRMLTNLIQFDAAANPGNSGGPLVTADGEVVGIVTAILNPGDQAVFIGIGFAVPIENAASAVGLSPF